MWSKFVPLPYLPTLVMAPCLYQSNMWGCENTPGARESVSKFILGGPLHCSIEVHKSCGVVYYPAIWSRVKQRGKRGRNYCPFRETRSGLVNELLDSDSAVQPLMRIDWGVCMTCLLPLSRCPLASMRCRRPHLGDIHNSLGESSLLCDGVCLEKRSLSMRPVNSADVRRGILSW